MNSSSLDLAGLLARCQTGIMALFQETSTRPERAARLAELLLDLSPPAGLTVCLLHGDGPSCLAIRPKGKAISAEGKNSLRSQLLSLSPLSPGIQTLPVAARPGIRLLTAAIGEPSRPRGFLAIGLPAGAAAKEATRAETLLTVAAPMVGLRGALEAARVEQAELARFALIGQAFLGLAHDLNNALNSMMLQTSVMQLRADEPTRNELAAVRQQGAQAAGLLRSLQHVVQERREQSYPVDLNSVLAAVLEEGAEMRRRVTVQPSDPAPSIHGTHGAIKQLVQLLLEGVLAGTKSAVRVRTEKQGDRAVLSVEIAETSAATAEEGGPEFADAILWQNLDEVARQAGQSLLRQLDGVLKVERRVEGGVMLRIVWGAEA
jgi:signal transduction histidine kinase